MQYLSTRDKSLRVSAAEAIKMGLSRDGGLFTPVNFPVLRALDAMEQENLCQAAVIALPIVGAAGALTNTVLVMGSIYFLLAPEFAVAKNVAMEAVLGLVMTVVTTSGVAEAVAAALLVTALCKALEKTVHRSEVRSAA